MRHLPSWRTSWELIFILAPGLSTPKTIVFPQPWTQNHQLATHAFIKYRFVELMSVGKFWQCSMYLSTRSIRFMHHWCHANTFEAIICSPTSHLYDNLLSTHISIQWHSNSEDIELTSMKVVLIFSFHHMQRERNFNKKDWCLQEVRPGSQVCPHILLHGQSLWHQIFFLIEREKQTIKFRIHAWITI